LVLTDCHLEHIRGQGPEAGAFRYVNDGLMAIRGGTFLDDAGDPTFLGSGVFVLDPAVWAEVGRVLRMARQRA
jgi:hypothetical protein